MKFSMDRDVYIQKGPKKICNELFGSTETYVTEIKFSEPFGYLYYIDDSGVDSFFQICENGLENYKLYEYDNCGIIKEHENISLDKLKEGFIKLSDFLKNATFVGREFERKGATIRYSYYGESHVEKRDASYVEGFNEGEKNIVLYIKGNIFLVKHITNNTCEYRIVGCRYTQDGNYKFLGPVYEEYNDRKKVYSEILEQINNYNKTKKRARRISRR